jgi:hypothetical protein
MYYVEFDPTQSLLRFTYSQRFTVGEAGRCAAEMHLLIPTLPLGIRALVDLSSLESMDLDCGPFITQVMDLLDQQGVSLVVRVIPDPHKDIGLNIMSAFHYRRSVRIVTCEKMEEAMRILSDAGAASGQDSGNSSVKRPCPGANNPLAQSGRTL